MCVYVHITHTYMYNISYVSRKVKTTYNFKQSGYNAYYLETSQPHLGLQHHGRYNA